MSGKRKCADHFAWLRCSEIYPSDEIKTRRRLNQHRVQRDGLAETRVTTLNGQPWAIDCGSEMLTVFRD